MSRIENKQLLLSFLETIRRPDVALDTVDESDGLVTSGLVDSLAVLQIVTFLEGEFGIDFAETGVDPDQLASIADILDLIDSRRV